MNHYSQVDFCELVGVDGYVDILGHGLLLEDDAAFFSSLSADLIEFSFEGGKGLGGGGEECGFSGKGGGEYLYSGDIASGGEGESVVDVVIFVDVIFDHRILPEVGGVEFAFA